MESLTARVRSSGRGLLGTWVKIPSLETMQLLGHAGFDFVVIDMEHAPHTLERAVELVFAAQAMGMAALVPLPEYLARGHAGLRMIQLEDWASLERAAEFAALEHVNGIFVGHGDLFLSSGKPASDPDVRQLTARMLAATQDAGILSGVAVGT